MTPSSKAGSTTWSVDQPSTQASATVSAPNSTLPRVERVKIHGSRRIATPRTRNPSRSVPVTLAHGHHPRVGGMTHSLRMAQRERTALCDTALQVGEDQPTLSGEWTVKDLVVHLLVREGSPAAAGIFVSPLARLTELESRRLGRRDFTVLVEKLRSGPPLYSPYAVPRLDAAAEHAGVLRPPRGHPSRPAGRGRPASLPAADEKLLWSMVRTAGKGLTRGRTGRRHDPNATTGSTHRLKSGDDHRDGDRAAQRGHALRLRPPPAGRRRAVRRRGGRGGSQGPLPRVLTHGPPPRLGP